MGLKVALDTSIFIYFLEQHPQFFEDSQFVLNKIVSNHWQGFASILTVGELLVMPFRIGHMQAVQDYARFIREFPNLQVLPIDESIMTETARLRASYPNLKTPDAIHLATALQTEVDCFITNDVRLARLSIIRIATLSEARNLS